MSFCWVSLC